MQFEPAAWLDEDVAVIACEIRLPIVPTLLRGPGTKTSHNRSAAWMRNQL